MFDPENPTSIKITEPVEQLQQGNPSSCSVIFKNSMKCPQMAYVKSGNSTFCIRHSKYLELLEKPKENKV